MTNWKVPEEKGLIPSGPVLVRGYLTATGESSSILPDSFVSLRENSNTWLKGNIFINGFHLTRYWNIGPTQTAYLPGPLLHQNKKNVVSMTKVAEYF